MTTLMIMLISGYVTLVLGVGTWAIVRAKREWYSHKKFIKSIKVGDIVKYRGFDFEIIEVNNPHVGPLTSIRMKAQGWLNEENFGFLRPTGRTR